MVILFYSTATTRGISWKRHPKHAKEGLAWFVVLLILVRCTSAAFSPSNYRSTRKCTPACLLGEAVPADGAEGTEVAFSSSRPEGSVEIVVPKHYGSDVSPMGFPYPSVLHSIHVQPLLSDTEAAISLDLARQHASQTGCWNEKDTERHSTYATVDFPIEECESLAGYLEDIDFHQRVLGRLSSEFLIDLEDMTYLDFFCANYEAKNGADDREESLKTMDRLAPHRDGSLLSFTVLLTLPSSFSGGGTVFDALRDVEPKPEHYGVLFPNGVVRPQRAGDCTLHSGKLLHGADPVASGTRTVLVAFVDVADWCQRPEVLSTACREFGRMDVASYRLRNQIKMTKGKAADGESDASGWFLRNDRWLPQGSGKSHIRGYVPAFEAVRKRGAEEFQRRKKLEAEDILLRDILLGEDERDMSSHFGGDVTVL